MAIMKPHKMDFHQRAVVSPIERMGKCSPRRMITMRATAFSQISASFRIAEPTVVSGTKNTNACRITTIAKSEIASPAHVARDTFLLTDDGLDVRPNGAATLSVSMNCSNKMPGHAVWIQENTRGSHATIAFAGCHWRCPGRLALFQGRGGGMI